MQDTITMCNSLTAMQVTSFEKTSKSLWTGATNNVLPTVSLIIQLYRSKSATAIIRNDGIMNKLQITIIISIIMSDCFNCKDTIWSHTATAITYFWFWINLQSILKMNIDSPNAVEFDSFAIHNQFLCWNPSSLIIYCRRACQ